MYMYINVDIQTHAITYIFFFLQSAFLFDSLHTCCELDHTFLPWDSIESLSVKHVRVEEEEFWADIW